MVANHGSQSCKTPPPRGQCLARGTVSGKGQRQQQGAPGMRMNRGKSMCLRTPTSMSICGTTAAQRRVAAARGVGLEVGAEVAALAQYPANFHAPLQVQAGEARLPDAGQVELGSRLRDDELDETKAHQQSRTQNELSSSSKSSSPSSSAMAKASQERRGCPLQRLSLKTSFRDGWVLSFCVG